MKTADCMVRTVDWYVMCLALENVQSELFDMKTKYDEATSAKYVKQIVMSWLLSKRNCFMQNCAVYIIIN